MELFTGFAETIATLSRESGLAGFFAEGGWKFLIMICVSFVLMYLAIVKGFEPLLLLPIAFGMFLANLPFGEIFHPDIFGATSIDFDAIVHGGGLIDLLYLGVKLGIYPPLIFLGIGAMTDFGPLIANPKSFLLGAAAQLGIFVAFLIAILIPNFGGEGMLFTAQEAGAIGIIGGADGPTAIYTAVRLAPHLIPSIAIAAYSYMALVPLIQPPIMKALTTQKERLVVMEQLRPVSRTERLVFPVAVTLIVTLLIPPATPLVGMLMLGNLFRESGCVDRITKTAQNELLNIITIFLGVSVGATANAERFLTTQTLGIIVLGLIAFAFGTVGGVLFGKVMYKFTGGKVNPLIGSAGVSAVPMAARVSQKVGQEFNPTNYLLMHAMGPNVAGVIGSAVAAGVLISTLS
jgi:oxaloacetate decarboxylase beta subunit